jgi:hypothetical protein
MIDSSRWLVNTMPRGGSREGAGRPPTARRVHLDEEHAQLLRELVRHWRARWPQGHYTAQYVVQDLIMAAALRERALAAEEEPSSPPRSRPVGVDAPRSPPDG